MRREGTAVKVVRTKSVRKMFRAGLFSSEVCMKKYFLLFAVVLAFALGGCADLAAKFCTVTFNANGVGRNPETLTVEVGTKLSDKQLPALPETDGKIFGGWFKEAACTNQWKNDSDTVTKNITLYAKWTVKAVLLTPLTPAIKRYTVKFDTQGIGAAPAALRVREGAKLSDEQLPALSKTDGKTFGGWFKESACINQWKKDSDTVVQNITLYAKWTTLYTVNFNARKIYTQSIAPVTVAEGDTISAGSLPSPSHRTWDFGGWYRDKTCTQAWTAADTVTADMTLYAKWMPKSIEAQDLWKSKISNGTDNYFRIPALAETKDGTLIAVTDLRYGHTADIGRFGPNGEWGQSSHIHRVDLVLKRSSDHGLTWDDSALKITNAPDNPVKYGYGDAAIVADRASDDVLILCAHGDTRYGHYEAGKQATRLKVVRLRSHDGGKNFTEPEEITDSIYNLNHNWGTLFFGSGKIMQSRLIKNSGYHRLYAVILVRNKSNSLAGNFVLYSDNFGETWHVLGSPSSSPVGNGDEAKAEELPDGRVLLSSRTKNGRLFNIFTYTNNASGTGSWGGGEKADLGQERGTNGEILIVPARNTATQKTEYLALQSIPLSSKAHPKSGEPHIRTDVGIYWRPIMPGITLDAFVNKDSWKKHQRFFGESGYSTMVMQQDFRLGFLFEKHDGITGAADMNDVYDIRYESLTLSGITGGQYEAAFLRE